MGKSSEFSYGWVVVGVGALMTCVAFGSMLSLAVFLQPISEAMGWSRSGVSAAATIDFLAMGLAAFFWGSLSDRFGTRIVVLSGTLLLGAEAIGQYAEQQPAAEAGEAGKAVDGDRGQGRDAADHGVAHQVEDRPGMRGAAGEMRACKDDELWRSQRLRDGPLPVRRVGSICGSRRRGRWRLSHQQRAK